MGYMMEVNLWGTVEMTKKMLPLLKKSKGRIINITSMAGREETFFHPVFNLNNLVLKKFFFAIFFHYVFRKKTLQFKLFIYLKDRGSLREGKPWLIRKKIKKTLKIIKSLLIADFLINSLRFVKKPPQVTCVIKLV